MKKIMLLSTVMVLIILFTSCKDKDNDSPVLGANVEVTVKNLLGIAQKNTTVYLYKDKEVGENTKPEEAQKQSVTNENGVAKFSLNFTELNILESQTSLYFAVFYQAGEGQFVAGSAGVTVKRNEDKKVELTIPL